MWQAHPNKSHIHVVEPKVLSNFDVKLIKVKAAVMNTFTEVKRNTRFLHILCPTNAYT